MLKESQPGLSKMLVMLLISFLPTLSQGMSDADSFIGLPALKPLKPVAKEENKFLIPTTPFPAVSVLDEYIPGKFYPLSFLTEQLELQNANIVRHLSPTIKEVDVPLVEPAQDLGEAAATDLDARASIQSVNAMGLIIEPHPEELLSLKLRLQKGKKLTERRPSRQRPALGAPFQRLLARQRLAPSQSKPHPKKVSNLLDQMKPAVPTFKSASEPAAGSRQKPSVHGGRLPLVEDVVNDDVADAPSVADPLDAFKESQRRQNVVESELEQVGLGPFILFNSGNGRFYYSYTSNTSK